MGPHHLERVEALGGARQGASARRPTRRADASDRVDQRSRSAATSTSTARRADELEREVQQRRSTGSPRSASPATTVTRASRDASSCSGTRSRTRSRRAFQNAALAARGHCRSSTRRSTSPPGDARRDARASSIASARRRQRDDPAQGSRRAPRATGSTTLAERVGAVNTFWCRATARSSATTPTSAASTRSRARCSARRAPAARVALLGAGGAAAAVLAARRAMERRARHACTIARATRAAALARALPDRRRASRDIAERGARRRDARRERDAGRAARRRRVPGRRSSDSRATPPCSTSSTAAARRRGCARRASAGIARADGLAMLRRAGRARVRALVRHRADRGRHAGRAAAASRCMTATVAIAASAGARAARSAPAARVRRLRAALHDAASDGLVCGALLVARSRRCPRPRCERCGHPRSRPAPCRWCDAAAAVRARRALASAGCPRAAARVDRARAQVRRLARASATGWRERMARARVAGDVIDERAALVPVPLAPSRERERGFNQSALLARGARARAGAFRCGTIVLVRTRATETQTRLTPEERLRNVAGAFRARRTRASRLRGAHLVLVDDVVTTAATLNACAAALLRRRRAHHQLRDLRPGARAAATGRNRQEIRRHGNSRRHQRLRPHRAAGRCAPRRSRASPTSTSSPSTTSPTRRRSRTCSSTTRCTAPIEGDVDARRGRDHRSTATRSRSSPRRIPPKLPWKDLGVDIVLESTGRFTDADEARASTSTAARRR